MGKKLTEDEIKWILSVESTEAQQEIHKLTQENKDLTKANKARLDQMIKLEAQGKKESAEWKQLDKIIKENTATIGKNKEMISALEGRMKTSELTMSQLRKKARDLGKQLDDTAKGLHPEEYARLEKELKDVHNRMTELKGSSKNVGDGFSKIKSIAATLGLAAIGASILAFFKSSTDAAIDVEQSMQRLSFAIKSVGGGSDSDIALLTKQAEELMGIFDDEAIKNAATKMLNFGLTVAQVHELMPGMVDAAAQGGFSLEEMATAIDKGVNSGVMARSSLGQLGLAFKDTGSQAENYAKIVEGLTKLEGANEAAMKSQWGTLQNLKIRWDEIKEAVGAVILKALMPLAEKLGKTLTDVPALTRTLAGLGKILLILGGYFLTYNAKLLLNNLLLKEGLGLKMKDMALKVKDIVVTKAQIITQAIYTATVNKTTLATKAAAIAQLLWNTAIKLNPLGLAIGILTTVVGLMWAFGKSAATAAVSQKQLTDTQKAQQNIIEKTNKDYGEQAAKIQTLNTVLHDEKIALSARQKALNDLKAIIPGYHGSLTKEGELINDNTIAIKDYLVQLEKQIRYDASKEEMTAAFKKKIAQENVLYDLVKKKADLEKEGPSTYKEGLLRSLNMQIGVSTAALSETNKVISSIGDNMAKLKMPGVKTPEETLTGGDKTDPLKAKVEQLGKELLAEQVSEKQKKQSKEELNAALLALDEKYIALKRDVYKKDTAEYNEYQNQLEDIARNKSMTANQASVKSLSDSNKSVTTGIGAYETAKKGALLSKFEKNNTPQGQEEYDTAIRALDVELSEWRLQNAKDYADIIRDTEFDSDADKAQAIEAADVAVKAAGDALLNANKAVLKNKADQVKKHEEDVAKIRQDFGLDKEKLSYQEGLAALKAKLKEGLATEQQTADAVAKYKLSKVQEYAEGAAQIVGTLSNLVSSIHESETSSLEAQKQKELSIAGNNADARQEIETRYAQKELDLKKKQADSNMGIAIAQSLAESALGIVKIWAIDGINPILAAALTAGLVAITIANIATATSQRDAIKNTTIAGAETGGYIDVTRAQDGKVYRNAVIDPDKRGYVDRPTILVGEGGKEWVASNAAMKNPTVASFINILDQHQQAGTIRTLDMNQLIRANMAGFASGGSVNQKSSSTPIFNKSVPVSSDSEYLSRLVMVLEDLSQNGVIAPIVLSELEAKTALRNRARNIGKK